MNRANTASIARDRLSAAVAIDRAIAAPRAETLSSDSVRMGEIFGVLPTAAGALVTETTAMRVATVYRCVSIIAGFIATLPANVYRRNRDGSREEVMQHELWWVLNEQACPLYTAASMWEYLTASMLLRGDGLALIDRPHPNTNKVRGLIPVPRDNWHPFKRDGALYYRIYERLDEGNLGYFDVVANDVIHFPGLGFDGMTSMSTIAYGARDAIGTAMRADEHAASTFAGGAAVQYALKSPKMMTAAQQDDLRQAWSAKYGSGVGVSKIPLVLTEGLDVAQMSMTAQDAQLIESRKYQRVDICTAFGIPPYMVGETNGVSNWGTGLEQQMLGFRLTTIAPTATRLVQELNRKLFPVRQDLFIAHDYDEMQFIDSKGQAEYFGKALGGPGAQGWMSVNEVRAKKKLPPKDGHDEVPRGGEKSAPPETNNTPEDAE